MNAVALMLIAFADSDSASHGAGV